MIQRRCHLTGNPCSVDCIPVLCLYKQENAELDTVDFLRNLAERLLRVPVMYGTDQGDVDRLNRIAAELERAEDKAPDPPRDWD